MGYTRRGVRDGTGPHKGSYQRRTSGSVGRRVASGKPCPKK